MKKKTRGLEMTEKEYLYAISKIRKKIATNNGTIIQEAAQDLQKFANIRPWRLTYFFAKVELMLYQGCSREALVGFMGKIDQNLYNHKELPDYFQVLKKVLPDENVLGKKKYEFLSLLYSQSKDANIYFQGVEKARNQFLADIFNMKRLRELAEQYYIIKNEYLYFLLMLLFCKKENKIINSYIQKDVLGLPNIGYLTEFLLKSTEHTFIVVANDVSNRQDYEVAAKVLQQLGHQVIFVDCMLSCEIENNIDIVSTLPISIENIEEKDGFIVIHPIEIIINGESGGNNRSLIIDYIRKNISRRHLAVLCCDDFLMDELQSSSNLCRDTQRMSPRVSTLLRKNLACGWTGEYLSYISEIHEFDAYKKIQEPASCEFSIVVPARNSAKTLRYTLQTCLEQQYEGSYEIVLSDNSSEGYTEVYDLYRELNDSRIKYYKTPRELNLCKSFEYACLQAKGEFVFSIGSDDAVLPWALKTLHDVLSKDPNDDVFAWERGFYAWPGFNYGQQNQLVIPQNYQKDKLQINRISTKEFLEIMFKDPSACMYMLPNLYINSGYRRKYLQKIINATGRLWDGCCQDIYMGIVNLAINESIPYIVYPITIAGMSGASLGAKNHTVQRNIEDIISYSEKGNDGNEYSVYQYNQLEYIYPEFLDTDHCAFYWSFLRLLGMECFSKDSLHQIDWYAVYSKMIMTLHLEDILLEKKINLVRYGAMQVDIKIKEKIEQVLEKVSLQPRLIEEKQIDETRVYQPGFQEQGLMLDASEFGVNNVYEAVRLFARITNL